MNTAEKNKPSDVTQATFQPHLLAVMARETGFKAGVVVYFKDTYLPLFKRMGITEDEYGDQTGRPGRPWTHQLIGLAFRNARMNNLAEQEGKGRWMLTDKGVDLAREILKKEGDTVPEQPKKEVSKDIDELMAESKAAAAAKTEEQAGEPSNVVELRKPDSRVYHDDPYIRSLAIEATPCFGWYSEKARVCGTCPLAGECAEKLLQTYAQIANEVKQEEKDARLRAEKAAAKHSAAKKSKATDELVDELESARAETTQKRNKDWDRSKAMTIRARANSKCRSCKETIPNGEEVFWIEGVGTFHKKCL